MLLLYFLGSYIRKYSLDERFDKKSLLKILIATTALNVLLNSLISIATGGKPHIPFARDCSVFIVIEATVLMMFFMKVEFHSDFINRVAKHVFAVYLFEGALRQIVQNIVFDYRITEEKEWNLLLVNLRAHNESGGDVSTLGVLERYDCRDWANWVDFEFGEQVPIFLMGISMGGAVAVMSSDLELPESVCGIIDDAGFTSPLEMIKIGSKEKLRFELLTDLFARIVNAGTKIWGGFDLKEANACAAVSKTSVPVLIIHGDKDKTAPVSMAYKIYKSCKSERELYIVSGAEHTGCYRTDPEKYKMIVSEFIEKHIPQ